MTGVLNRVPNAATPADTRPGERSRSRVLRRRPSTGWLTVAALVGCYQLWSDHADSLYFPSVPAIGHAFWTVWTSDAVSEQLVPSVARMFAGWLIAVVIGVSLGVAMGRQPVVSRTLDPFLQFMRAIPPPALVPIAVLAIGINSRMQILVIAFGSVWPILLNSIEGASNVPRERMDTAAIFGLPSRQSLLRVVLPSAAPSILAGVRIGISLALVMMVVSELTASTNGLGYLILSYERSYEIPEMYAGILAIGVIGIILNKVFDIVERRFVAWQFGPAR